MRLFLTTLFMLAAAPAWAEWVKMAEDSHAVYYIERATVQQSSAPAATQKSSAAAKTRKTTAPAAPRKTLAPQKVWEMQDLKQRGPDGELSMRMFSEFDCKEERSRVLSISKHPDVMAGGRTIFSSDTAGQWNRIPPNTPSEIILRRVCAD